MSERRIDTKLPNPSEKIVEAVRDRYGKIARGATGGCCASSEGEGCHQNVVAASLGYSRGELSGVPEGANLGLGCGAPVRFLELRWGETVLDLGSGPGLDAFLAAREVGPTGYVIGVDMTPEMIDKARNNARKTGATNVEFRSGRLESLPVGDATVDAVTSNCVINLVPDKKAVFREVARVLRPGGRVVVSDIVLDGRLPEGLERDLLAWVGCVAGAVQRGPYFDTIREAGLTEIEILSDADFMTLACGAFPEDALPRLQAAGVRPEDLEGRIHSVTYRAVKPR